MASMEKSDNWSSAPCGGCVGAVAVRVSVSLRLIGFLVKVLRLYKILFVSALRSLVLALRSTAAIQERCQSSLRLADREQARELSTFERITPSATDEHRGGIEG